MNKLLSVIAIFCVLLSASCQKSELSDLANTDNLVSVKQAAIVSVNGPLTASIYQEVGYTVSWPYSGNCEKFRSFKTEILGDTTFIKLYTATNPTEDCSGTEVQRSSVYKFKPAKAGTYFLKFFSPGSKSGIIDTVRVK